MSVGCHDLLRRDVDPALLVTSVEDVLAVVGRAGEGLARRDPGPADVRSELDELDPTARRVFEGLPARRFAGPQEIAARSGVSPLDVIRVLPTLDIAGLVEASDVGEYRVSPRVRSRVWTA
jgi:DNA processing protein